MENQTKYHPATKPRLLVVVPGFGSPELATKADILRKNMSMLPDSARFLVCAYDAAGPAAIPHDLRDHPRIQWAYETAGGVLGAMLHRHVTPEAVRDFSHVMLLLDDAELLNMVQPDLLDLVLDRYGLDILSPTLLDRASTFWPFMVHDPVRHDQAAVRAQTVVELFCYYMRRETYERYYGYIDPSNPWMWGMDFMLNEYFSFRPAVMNLWVLKHHFRSYNEEANQERRAQSLAYVRRYDASLTWERLYQVPRTLFEVGARDLLYLCKK